MSSRISTVLAAAETSRGPGNGEVSGSDVGRLYERVIPADRRGFTTLPRVPFAPGIASRAPGRRFLALVIAPFAGEPALQAFLAALFAHLGE